MQTTLWSAAALTLSLSSPAAAQFPPDSFVNLKVLPADIGPRALVDVMRGFATSLGVRCEFCHVGEPGQPLETFDFPADEKPTKEKARAMLRMVAAINSEHIANLRHRSDPPIEVSCVTCHHGLNRPVSLVDDLLRTQAAAGIDSTIARYRGLREEYYGGWQYDFSLVSLNGVGESLAAAGHFDDALAILNVNLEFHQDNPFIYVAIAQVHLRQDDRALAIRAMERAVDLDPDNAGLRRFLDQIRGNDTH